MNEERIVTNDSNSAMTGAMLGSMFGKGNNDLAMLAALNEKGGSWDNPFVYLVWMMFASRFMNNGGDQSQLNTLQTTVQDNHNSDLLMSAVNGSTEAVRGLAAAMNANFDNVNAAICCVRNGITEANGNIQLAAERMIANNNMQSGILGGKIDQTGCNIKSAIIEQGYQNQLGNCQQTNTILMQSQALQNTIQNGFTNIGFLLERNACDIKEVSTANTQKIVDTLNNHWNIEAQTTIQQLRDEIGRLNQTQALIAALKTTATA